MFLLWRVWRWLPYRLLRIKPEDSRLTNSGTWDLSFSRRWKRIFWCSGLWCHVTPRGIVGNCRHFGGKLVTICKTTQRHSVVDHGRRFSGSEDLKFCILSFCLLQNSLYFILFVAVVCFVFQSNISCVTRVFLDFIVCKNTPRMRFRNSVIKSYEMWFVHMTYLPHLQDKLADCGQVFTNCFPVNLVLFLIDALKPLLYIISELIIISFFYVQKIVQNSCGF
jgi:hypothetical protein